MPFFPFTYNTHPHSILTLAPQVLTAALEGSLYPLSDVVTSDIQLGEDPLDRSCKPTPKKVSDGFKLNMKLIEYLLVSNFQLVILCVGMTASVELTDILNKKQGCLATSTYHPVLVASDTRNEVTSAAARLTLAAGARLTRLALDATLNSESEAPGLLDIFSTLMDSKDKAKETLTSSCTLDALRDPYYHPMRGAYMPRPLRGATKWRGRCGTTGVLRHRIAHGMGARAARNRRRARAMAPKSKPADWC